MRVLKCSLYLYKWILCIFYSISDWWERVPIEMYVKSQPGAMYAYFKLNISVTNLSDSFLSHLLYAQKQVLARRYNNNNCLSVKAHILRRLFGLSARTIGSFVSCRCLSNAVPAPPRPIRTGCAVKGSRYVCNLGRRGSRRWKNAFKWESTRTPW